MAQTVMKTRSGYLGVHELSHDHIQRIQRQKPPTGQLYGDGSLNGQEHPVKLFGGRFE